jgi:hypothetical protein
MHNIHAECTLLYRYRVLYIYLSHCSHKKLEIKQTLAVQYELGA